MFGQDYKHKVIEKGHWFIKVHFLTPNLRKIIGKSRFSKKNKFVSRLFAAKSSKNLCYNIRDTFTFYKVFHNFAFDSFLIVYFQLSKKALRAIIRNKRHMFFPPKKNGNPKLKLCTIQFISKLGIIFIKELFSDRK